MDVSKLLLPPYHALIFFLISIDGVPDSVRHFLGLWAVGSLIGTTMDVDLFALRSQGLIRVLVAIKELKG
jgi:hypothetical protein